jgi:CBS domain-containing protein
MAPMPTIGVDSTVQQAAAKMIEASSSILAVVGSNCYLEGVLTRWDITRATALSSPDDQPLQEIMTRQVIAAAPEDTVLELVRKLEHYEISAMPVVEGSAVLGMVTTDLLSRRSLLRLLQSQG